MCKPTPVEIAHEAQSLIQRQESTETEHTEQDVEDPDIAIHKEGGDQTKHDLIRLCMGPWLDRLCRCSWRANNEDETSKPRKTTSSLTLVQITKYIISVSLLTLVVSINMAGIFAVQTPVAMSLSPFVAFSIVWLLILWLGVLEGGQGSLVGLQPIDKSLYATSHPITHQCTAMVHQGDNLNRFIIGRQFAVVLVVFCINLCCTVVEDAVVPGFNHILVEIFLASGIGVMIITVIVGQLAAEVNATNCMLDFMNTPVMVVTTWICLAIEASGLLHSVYLFQKLFAWCTGEAGAIEEPVRTPMEQQMYWLRTLISLALLAVAMTVTIAALMVDETTMYEGLPNSANVVIFFLLICFLGMLEAMQIALFAVVNLSAKEVEAYPKAKANCKLVFQGQNFKAFLIGRQICVTFSMFLLARITTTNVDPATQVTVMNVSSAVQNFFNTGLPGALITTIVASLAWRIIASSYPILFMANPLVEPTIRVCLMLEASGVFSAAWLLADTLKALVGFQEDSSYIGSIGQGGHGAPADFEDSDDEEQGIALEPTTTSTYGATTH